MTLLHFMFVIPQFPCSGTQNFDCVALFINCVPRLSFTANCVVCKFVVLLCFIDLKVKKIRNEASSCPEIVLKLYILIQICPKRAEQRQGLQSLMMVDTNRVEKYSEK